MTRARPGLDPRARSFAELVTAGGWCSASRPHGSSPPTAELDRRPRCRGRAWTTAREWGSSVFGCLERCTLSCPECTTLMAHAGREGPASMRSGSWTHWSLRSRTRCLFARPAMDGSSRRLVPRRGVGGTEGRPPPVAFSGVSLAPAPMSRPGGWAWGGSVPGHHLCATGPRPVLVTQPGVKSQGH